MVDLKIVEAFFFKAMIAGYAANAQKTKVPDMPGYKEIRFREGDFLLVDRWCTTPNSSKSAGTMTIWYQDVAVWVMHYGGLYEKQAIPFLKKALRMAYEERLFLGGRGLRVFEDEELRYINDPLSGLNRFSDFEGPFEWHEAVFDMKTKISLGWHNCWGMSLL